MNAGALEHLQSNDGYGGLKSGESELDEPLITSPVIEYLDEQWEPMRVRLRQLKKEELGRMGKENGLALDTNRRGSSSRTGRGGARHGGGLPGLGAIDAPSHLYKVNGALPNAKVT